MRASRVPENTPSRLEACPLCLHQYRVEDECICDACGAHSCTTCVETLPGSAVRCYACAPALRRQATLRGIPVPVFEAYEPALTAYVPRADVACRVSADRGVRSPTRTRGIWDNDLELLARYAQDLRVAG